MPGRPKGRSRRFEFVKLYLQKHPYATNKEAVKDCNVSERLVSNARTELRRAGLVPPAPGGLGAAKNHIPPEGLSSLDRPDITVLPAMESVSDDLLTKGTKELLDISSRAGHSLDYSGDLDPKEMLQTLQGFIRSREFPPAVVMAAMQLYTKIKSDLLGRDSIGPGAPLTIEDQIYRLSLLLKAVGLKTAMIAMETAFEIKETPNGESSVNKTESPSGVTEATIPPGHENKGPEAPELRAE